LARKKLQEIVQCIAVELVRQQYAELLARYWKPMQQSYGSVQRIQQGLSKVQVERANAVSEGDGLQGREREGYNEGKALERGVRHNCQQV
jgi:hypothetical protein